MTGLRTIALVEDHALISYGFRDLIEKDGQVFFFVINGNDERKIRHRIS